MKYRPAQISLIILLCFAFYKFNLYAEEAYKEVQILGLKAYTEKFLLQNIDLKFNADEKEYFASASKNILSFYQKSGYLLARAYLIKETENSLIIFLDEGALGKIVFKRLSTIDTIKIKYEFTLKSRIFNKHIVENEIVRLKKKYKFKDIRYSLVPATAGDKAYFQLDDKILIPGLGETRIPFFKEYSSRYNLEIEFIPEAKSNQNDLSYGIKLHYTKGLIPSAEYYYPSFLQRKDLLTIGASIGLFYGLDLKFKNPPKWTFMETHSDYHFAPLFEEYFTPMVSASAYYSRASRKDLGLNNYNYLKLKSVLAPGITLLKKLRFYSGIGGERVYIFSPQKDEDADYNADINKDIDNWAVLESRIKIDARPWTLKNTRRQEFETVYNYYKNKKSFHEVKMKWNGDIEFDSLDFFIFTIDYSRIWHRPPFYHEYSVSDANFKGFMGKSYYTRNMIRSANEYKVSVYRDLYHFGFFTDLVHFEGSGYDLFGEQNGLVSGIAGHIIFLDQFEFNIFFGKDYLFSTKESQYNIYMNANKKW